MFFFRRNERLEYQQIWADCECRLGLVMGISNPHAKRYNERIGFDVTSNMYVGPNVKVVDVQSLARYLISRGQAVWKVKNGAKRRHRTARNAPSPNAERRGRAARVPGSAMKFGETPGRQTWLPGARRVHAAERHEVDGASSLHVLL
jgi:hypothetical protein